MRKVCSLQQLSKHQFKLIRVNKINSRLRGGFVRSKWNDLSELPTKSQLLSGLGIF